MSVEGRNRVTKHRQESGTGRHLGNRNDLKPANMAQSLIPTPEKMNMKGDLVSNWEYFKDSWNNYATATEVSKKSEEIVVVTLLSIMGKECHQIYKNLPLSAEERKKTRDSSSQTDRAL